MGDFRMQVRFVHELWLLSPDRWVVGDDTIRANHWHRIVHWRTLYEMAKAAQDAKVYRLKWWRRASAILFVVLGVLSLTGFCWGPIFGHADPKPMGVVFSAAFTLFGIIWTISAFKSTVTLFNDAIEVRGMLGYQRLPLNGIRGRREYLAGAGEGTTRYLKLVPDDDRLSPLEFEKYFTFDDTFYQWFYKLPDLDAMDKMKHKDADFGLV